MTDLEMRRRPRRWVGWGAGAVGVLVAGAGIGWAASTVLTPPTDVLDTTAFTFVEVVNGEVGSSVNLNTVAEWTPVPVGSNFASGTVTSVSVSAGQEVGAGAQLYSPTRASAWSAISAVALITPAIG